MAKTKSTPTPQASEPAHADPASTPADPPAGILASPAAPVAASAGVDDSASPETPSIDHAARAAVADHAAALEDCSARLDATLKKIREHDQACRDHAEALKKYQDAQGAYEKIKRDWHAKIEHLRGDAHLLDACREKLALGAARAREALPAIEAEFEALGSGPAPVTPVNPANVNGGAVPSLL